MTGRGPPCVKPCFHHCSWKPFLFSFRIERPVETEGANRAAFGQAFTSPNGSPRINMENLEKGTVLKGNFIIQPSILEGYMLVFMGIML